MYSASSGAAQNTQPVMYLPTIRAQRYPSFSSNLHTGFAIAHLSLGCLCIAFNTVAIIAEADSGYVAIGIWGGIFMMVCGSIGMVTVKEKGPCSVTTTLIMSILSAVVGGGVLITFSKGLSEDMYDRWVSFHDTRIAMDICLIICGFTEGIIGIVQAALCCKAMGTETAEVNQNQPLITNTCLSSTQQNLAANQQLYTSVQGQMVPVNITRNGTMITSQAASGQQVSNAANVMQLPNQPQVGVLLSPPAYI